MWPYMGSMGWWMVFWWVAGIVILVLVVRLVAGSLGGPGPCMIGWARCSNR